MKQKTKFILSSLTLLLFALLAGGSYDDFTEYFLVIIGIVVTVIIGVIIQGAIQSRNKKKRLEMIKQDESAAGDFDRSVSFGNDRCMFYFDSSKRKVMIMRIMTEGIKKTLIDNFDYSGKEFCYQDNPYFCIYDDKNRRLLCGNYEKMDITYECKDIAAEDKCSDIEPNNSIKAKIITHYIKYDYATNGGNTYYIYTLIDECHGLIALVRNGKLSSIFNYIKRDFLSKKKGDKSYINNSFIGNYNFIMDEFFKVLVVVTPSSYELFNYSDIIEVSYEENGTQLYSKSALRTVGGAIIGGALMGGAGAVVGGLSGDSTQNLEINSMDIKLLLRDTQKSTCILHFNNSKRILKTKNAGDKSLYQQYQKEANKAKDLISVIIDKAKQVTTVPQTTPLLNSQSSVADELAKLVKLKSDVIITDEEFQVQKNKLLNS